ncbi:NAD(P)-binding protein [Hypoxylon rubiginosum]|uniref:NAD(P)-binding protein n=1 Tax=Hypoxylon rubiginosum TaxID=110542 RepID=A0ACC0CWE1_9PEZI|nr:NAD(P)-binding protein [Hypoxylon rubiginosum]
MTASIAQTSSTGINVERAYDYRSRNANSDPLRKKIAVALGYKPSDFTGAAADANIGEGCGNPLLIANLKEGDFVVDLGSGGGFDCFLASKQVGPAGKVVGFDMTENMVKLARRNGSKLGLSNVEFVHANINKLPLPDNSVDCVMSNCVLNLVPDDEKLAVVGEIHRILKPCGRLAISDFLALKPMPSEIKDDPALRSGCVSGAVEVDRMKQLLFDIGFDDILLVDTKKDLNLYKENETSKSVTPCCAGGGSCEPAALTASGRKELDYDLNEYICKRIT